MSDYTVKCPYCDVAKPNHRLPMHMLTEHRAAMAAEPGIAESLRGPCGAAYLLGGQTYYMSFGTENGRGTIFKSATWAAKHVHERCNAECKAAHKAKAAELLAIVPAPVRQLATVLRPGELIEFRGKAARFNGNLLVRTDNGATYMTPSGFAKDVAGYDVNGWLGCKVKRDGQAIRLTDLPPLAIKTLRVKRLAERIDHLEVNLMVVDEEVKEVAAEVKEVAGRVAAIEAAAAEAKPRELAMASTLILMKPRIDDHEARIAALEEECRLKDERIAALEKQRRIAALEAELATLRNA